MTFQGGACSNEDWQPTTVEYASMRVCEYADRTRHQVKSPTEMRNPAHRDTTQQQRYATYMGKIVIHAQDLRILKSLKFEDF